MKKLLTILILWCSVSVQAAFLPPLEYQDISGTVSQTLNETLEFTNEGFGTILFYIDVPTGGAVTFQMAVDSTWESISLRSITNDIFGSVLTADGFYVGSVIGASKIRFLTSTGGSADGSVDGQFVRAVSMLEGIEFGNPPHRFGYAPIHVDAHYTTAQTGTVIFTPDSGKTSVVTDFYLVVSGSTDCNVKIFDETDSAGNYIFYADVEVATNKNFVFGHSFVTPYVASAADNSWKITTDAACTVDLIGHGYQF